MSGPVLLVCQRSARLPFIFEAAARAGIPLIALHDSDEPAPTDAPGVVRTLALPVFSDPEAALDDLAALAPALGVAGVLTLREEAVVWTARAAARLGLPSISVEAARATRDKAAMRDAFREAGMASPGYVRLDDPADVSPAASLTPPLVVKPSGGWSSTGVALAQTREALPAVAAEVAAIQSRDLGRFYEAPAAASVVVEEYLDGAEFVVECFIDADGVHVLSVGEKGRPVGPWFEETIYRVRADIEDPTIAAVIAEAISGVRALGLTTGAAHAELRLDRMGRPHVLEIGARIGGSGVSHFIVEQSTGLSFGALCLNAAMGLPGQRLPPVVAPNRIAANYIIPLGGHGRFGGIDRLDEVAAHPDTRRIVPLLAEGANVPPPPAFAGYPGFIFSVHANAAKATAYHDWLDRTVRVVWG